MGKRRFMDGASWIYWWISVLSLHRPVVVMVYTRDTRKYTEHTPIASYYRIHVQSHNCPPLSPPLAQFMLMFSFLLFLLCFFRFFSLGSAFWGN
ncbi:hypothetical protein BDZ91DRAFT_729459 [Kalaharituber pfeilii]|nr:hypothetical protein BDZ91DRAFT_729459 [Kalaharituber pfeilii]